MCELINTLEFYVDEYIMPMLFFCILIMFSELRKPIYEAHKYSMSQRFRDVLGEYLRRDRNNGSLVTRS